jgi:DNA-binding CsgD family transcriptional regulator
VLALLAEGLDPRAIARTLGISINTSRGHVKSVISKLGAHSQLEAVVSALRMGLLDITPATGAAAE